jgi:hypothetical protein
VENSAGTKRDESNWSVCQTDGQWRVDREMPPTP